MANCLDGVYARLDRAKENIAHLDREIAAFKQTDPYPVLSQYDPKSGNIAETVIHKHSPPPRLPVLAGEILFLLRSSLDHLIAQMLIPITPAASIDAVLERSGFPIYTESTKWQSFDWTKIPGISTDARTAITDAQPCNRKDGLPIEDHPLAVLSSLNNIDKHRLLLVLIGRATLSSVKLGESGSVYVKTLTVRGSAMIGSSNAQADLMRGTVLFPRGTPKSNVKVQTTIEITFKKVGTRQGEPVVPTLEHLLKFVGELTDSFGRRFFS